MLATVVAVLTRNGFALKILVLLTCPNPVARICIGAPPSRVGIAALADPAHLRHCACQSESCDEYAADDHCDDFHLRSHICPLDDGYICC